MSAVDATGWSRRWISRLGVLLPLAATPLSAAAAPIQLVEQRESFMLFDDIDDTIRNGNFFSRDPFFVAYDAIESGFLAVHPDDSQFLVVYTTWSLPPPVGALFQAVANDVHGIGYEHIAPLDAVIPQPYFDDTPNSQVHGFLHMSNWQQYLGGDPDGVDQGKISLYFGQEFGHAWLAFVHVTHPGVDSRALLGRADAHWSFYMQTGGSPVQGHDWVDNGDGTFTAMKKQVYEFSDLDLYLMGLLPPDQVAPWFVLENPQNCVDSAAPDGSCAAPTDFLFSADSYTISATRQDLTIDDVIASEGARMPAWPDAPNEYDVSFLLIKSPDENLDESSLLLVDAIVDHSIAQFNDQTRGLAAIVNRTTPDDGAGTGSSGGSDGGAGSDTGASSAGATSGGTTTGTSGPATTSNASGSPTGNATTASTGGTGTDGAGATDGSGGSGCGCRSHARPLGGGLVLLLGTLLGTTRRRRRPRARDHG